MNEHKLQQDHPCVIEMIQRHFIRPPPPRSVPYSFANVTEFNPDWSVKSVLDPNGDPSAGQIAHIRKLLKNMVGTKRMPPASF